MAKCMSWRYTPTPQHASHLPGECRECWAPCTEKVADRGTRCEACLNAVLACPDHRVRRALLHEDDVDQQTLLMLAQDAYPMIAMAAKQKLGNDWDQTTPPGVAPHPTTGATDLT